jgi:hypothetical protein
VDAVPPTVASIDTDSPSPTNTSSVTFVVTFSEAVTGVNASEFTLHDTGTIGGTIASVTPVNSSTYLATVSSVSGDGTMRLDLNSSGTAIADLATNPIATGYTGGQFYTIERTPPAVTSVIVPGDATYIAGQNLDFTTTFSEAVAVTGTPRIAVTLDTGGTVYASYVSGSGTNTLTFQYTVVAGQRDLTGIVTGSSIDTNGGTITDAATNNAVLVLNGEPSTAGIDVDAISPAVASVAVPVNGTYGNAQDLDFTVNLTKNAIVDTTGGTPYMTLTLDTGGTVDAMYISGSGTSALTFRYVVASGNVDSNGISVGSSIALNGGAISDSHGDAATLALSNIGSTAGVRVDAIAPGVVSVGVPAPGDYVAGESLDFTVNFSKPVTVDTSTGRPQIALELASGVTVYADYVSGGGTAALTFRYVVAKGDLDTTGISVASNVILNGGTLRDAAGNSADLMLSGVGSTANVDVGVVAVSPPAGRGLLPGTEAFTPLKVVNPYILLLPPTDLSAQPAHQAEAPPTTFQTVWSPVPLLSAGQEGFGNVDIGINRGDAIEVGISALDHRVPSEIDSLVNPLPVEWVELPGHHWEFPWAPALRPTLGKESLNEQFSRYGRSAWQREQSRLVRSAQRISRRPAA